MENRMGTAIQASDYCKKGDQSKDEFEKFKTKGPNFGKNADFREYGKLSNGDGQGKRNDLEKAANEIRLGKSMVEMRQDNIQVCHQYGRVLGQLEQDLLKMRRRHYKDKPRCATLCKWYWGGTGVGKSWLASLEEDEKNHYTLEATKGWFCDYRHEPICLIQDFRGEIKYPLLLNLLDWTNYKITRKGEPAIHFTSKLVIITSNKHPEDFYGEGEHDDISQLLRRIQVINIKSQDDSTAEAEHLIKLKLECIEKHRIETVELFEELKSKQKKDEEEPPTSV